MTQDTQEQAQTVTEPKLSTLLEFEIDIIDAVEYDHQFVLTLQHSILDAIRVRYGNESSLAIKARWHDIEHLERGEIYHVRREA